ncbi:MAG: glycosyltransferase family 39 protein [Cyanobacteria bacterium P01_A01_bin.114]
MSFLRLLLERRSLYILIITAVLLGGLFRLVNLGGKVYWHDETYTALYATGHSNLEASSALFDGQLKTVADVLPFQTVTPGRGLGATIRQLAANDAQHPPLYYLAVRLVMYGIGDPVLATRLVAAIAGILLIPAVYWLSLELFSSPVTASISAALIAVSPFHYLYAQEAREYSLWALAIALTSIALFKALRKNSLLGWLTYAAAMTASLYVCVLTLLMAASHSGYVIWQTVTGQSSSWQTRYRTVLRNFALSVGASLLLFTPWLQFIFRSDLQAVMGWTAVPMSTGALAKIWAGNLTRLFFDLNLDATDPLFYTIPPILLALALIGYTLIWATRHLPKSALIFLALLGGITLVALAGPDLVSGGRRSSISRYLTPTYLGLQLALAYLLAQKLSARRARLFWRGTLVSLIMAGILSCAVSLPADTWWHKKNSHLNPEVVRVIDSSPNTLLISSNHHTNLGEIFSLCHLLSPEQALLLFNEPDRPVIPEGFDQIFIFNVSHQARNQLDQMADYKVAPAYEGGRLWQLKAREKMPEQQTS